MIYRHLFTLVLSRLDAETTHHLAALALRLVAAMPGVRPALRRSLGPRDRALEVEALGLRFPAPLGVAAGFDKEARHFEVLGALGFGFVEVGTVTALAQPGNPRPRIFRLPRDRALVNRMGFPNPGADAVAPRLEQRPRSTIVGINVGKTKVVAFEDVTDDYRASTRRLAPHADYLVVNVSSPNTPGLLGMQDVERLGALVAAVRDEARRVRPGVPVLVKIGPDLAHEQIDAIADLALELGVDGIVAVNTSVHRNHLRTLADEPSLPPDGGVSGAPLKRQALDTLRRLHARAGGRLVLISVGGVETSEDAWERIRAGATLVQGYTGFVYGGPLWAHRVHCGLRRLLDESGLGSIEAAVGSGAREP